MNRGMIIARGALREIPILWSSKADLRCPYLQRKLASLRSAMCMQLWHHMCLYQPSIDKLSDGQAKGPVLSVQASKCHGQQLSCM